MTHATRQPEKIGLGITQAGIGHGVDQIPVVVHNVGVEAIPPAGGRTAAQPEVVMCYTLKSEANPRGWKSLATGDVKGDGKPLSLTNRLELRAGIQLPPAGSKRRALGAVSTNGSNVLLIHRFLDPAEPEPTPTEAARELAMV